MIPNKSVRTIAAIVSTAALFGVPAMSTAQGSHGGGHGTSTAPPASAGSNSADMMSMMKQGHEKMMSMPMTGKPDVDFAMMMRMHHMQAIEMAQVEVRSGKEPKMRNMARKMISEQKKEIAQLEAFLSRQGHNMPK